jgi:hypothetical protein
MPSLRWHYPDQVNGYDLSRALVEEGSTPWLEFLNLAGAGKGRKRGGETAQGNRVKVFLSILLRHCERSEAIYFVRARNFSGTSESAIEMDCFAPLAMTDDKSRRRVYPIALGGSQAGEGVAPGRVFSSSMCVVVNTPLT